MPTKRILEELNVRFHAIDNQKFKETFLNAFPFWLGAFITGLISVLYTKLFLWAEEGTVYLFHQSSWVFLIVTPVCFVLAWWLVEKYAPFSRGSGIPQVSAAIELTNPEHDHKVRKLLSLKVILVKVLSSLIMVFGGGVIGREGPTIQIAASVFKKINDWLPGWYPKITKQNMIITGAAAGLASAFNTPLGGIVFAIEELTQIHFNFFKSDLLSGVIIAGLTALYFSGPYLYLGFPALHDVSVWVIFQVMLVAVLGGALSGGMGKIILYLFKMKASFKNYQKLLYVVACGLMVASLAVFVDVRMFGSGKEIMLATLFTDNKEMEWYMPVLRIIGPILSFSTGAAGGIFAPSLSAGNSLGAVISGWFHLTGTETNLVVLCGMVGFLTGITRSPFTSSILVIEMTNSHSVIFHLMLTALLANMVSNLVSKQSFYEYLKEGYLKEIHASGAGDVKNDSSAI